jgi:transcriptional regulator with XRE-family HTH domain
VTGAELRALRTALGLTQRALGKELGVPQSTVWRWESAGEHVPQGPLLRLALEALAKRPKPPARATSRTTKKPGSPAGVRARARDADLGRQSTGPVPPGTRPTTTGEKR